MKKVTFLFLACLIIGFADCHAQPMDAYQNPIAITEVNVIDVKEGEILENQSIIITNDRITGLAPADSLAIPNHATTIDGRDKYLIPGLWDMHTHITDQLNVPFEDRKAIITLLVVHGITGIRDMGSALSQINRLRNLKINRQIIAPEIVAAGPYVDDDPPVWPNSVSVQTDTEAREAVNMLNQKQGVDFIKVYGKLNREAYFAIAEEANRLGIPFAGHLPVGVSFNEAIEVGQRSFEHGDSITYLCTDQASELQKKVLAAGNPESRDPETLKAWLIYSGMDKGIMASFDPSECSDLLNEIAQKNIWITPTLTVFNGFNLFKDSTHTDERFKFLPPAYKEKWNNRIAPPDSIVNSQDFFESRLHIIKALQKSGVSLLAGTDMPDLPFTFPGSSLHDELSLMVQAGLTPDEALKAATLNPAKYLARDYELGTVAVERMADLVLLDDNPLEDIENIRNINAVVIRGQLLDRAALDSMMEKVKQEIGNYSGR